MDKNTVYARLSDHDTVFSVHSAQAARNILMHERNLCDDCGKPGGNARVYIVQDYPGNDFPVMMLLCRGCASGMGLTRRDRA